ncbi:MAG: bifunctional acetaldehyde-CoA/alcohol dehydrogenase, partial [Christensenellaceae bacterium]
MTETKNAAPVSPEIVDSAESLQLRIAEVKAAQKKFSTYTQEQVDKIFKAAAMAGNAKRIPLAQMAKAETKMGLVEDKVIKNHFATEYIYNAYKNCQTVGKFDEDTSFGFYRVYEPIGVIAAVVPTTNPTSTA